MAMKVTRVELQERGFRAIFDAWADKDGRKRAERVAVAMRSSLPVATGALRDSVRVVRDEHPTRPAYHIGPTEWYGIIIEARTGAVSRALDAGA